MHPVEEIIAAKWDSMKGKCILLGVTYSVSLYRSIDLARELIKRGAKVKVMMTDAAAKVISPELFEWATGERPIVGLSGATEHVSEAKECDVMVISPATLNTISKIAYGIADENVALTAINFLGYKKFVIIFPVMHASMYFSVQLKRAVQLLEDYNNVVIIPPIIENGRVKLPDVEAQANVIEGITLRGRDYKGIKALVTAGPTREYFDKIRFISNPSSGKMGASLAWELYARGADVVLIHGPSSASFPPWTNRIEVETTEEMAEAVKSVEDVDVAFFAAAPADYKPKERFEGKLDSTEEITLELVPTPKVAKESSAKVNVGFTAVVGDNIIDTAIKKLESYGFDMIVANRVDLKDIGFRSDKNEVFIISKDGRIRHVPKLPKLLVARAILDESKELL